MAGTRDITANAILRYKQWSRKHEGRNSQRGTEEGLRGRLRFRALSSSFSSSSGWNSSIPLSVCYCFYVESLDISSLSNDELPGR